MHTRERGQGLTMWNNRGNRNLASFIRKVDHLYVATRGTAVRVQSGHTTSPRISASIYSNVHCLEECKKPFEIRSIWNEKRTIRVTYATELKSSNELVVTLLVTSQKSSEYCWRLCREESAALHMLYGSISFLSICLETVSPLLHHMHFFYLHLQLRMSRESETEPTNYYCKSVCIDPTI